MPATGEAFIIARAGTKYFMWIVSFMDHNDPTRQISSSYGRRLKPGGANKLRLQGYLQGSDRDRTHQKVIFKATPGTDQVFFQKHSLDRSGAILQSSSFIQTNRKWV